MILFYDYDFATTLSKKAIGWAFALFKGFEMVSSTIEYEKKWW